MSENSTKKLFTEFPGLTTDQWNAKIKTDLKGADYVKKLVWKTIEGIDIKPFYRNEDLTDSQYLESKPGTYPYVRGNRKYSNDWAICQKINVSDFRQANSEALNAINLGASSVEFILGNEAKSSASFLDELLNDIVRENVGIHFYPNSGFHDLLINFRKYIESKSFPEDKISGIIGCDPLGELILNGKFQETQEKSFRELRDMFDTSEKKFPHYRILAINGRYFKNAGSTNVQELGYTLAAGVEYLNNLTDYGLSVDDITGRIQINFAVGSNYFMEIAKIRATRLLWSKIIEAYNPKHTESAKIYIHTETSDWNKTLYDPYVNLLRTTTEAMSASLGGVDSMTIHPLDSIFTESTEVTKRLARNIQIILKEEAYFNKVADVAAGSYFVENLTDMLADRAWKLFLEIEEQGGFIHAFRKGIIQSDIEENAVLRDENISHRRKNILGTNQYPNLKEKISDMLDPTILSGGDKEQNEDGVKPLNIYRAAENFEKLRLRTERFQGKTPKVYLFKVGNLAMRIARATFASNFFGCGGFEIIEGPGYPNIQQGLDECRSHNPDIVAICSSDEEYREFVPELLSEIDNEVIFVIAGYPSESIKQFIDLGVKFFIHTRSNVIETIEEIQERLGIK